MLLFHLGIGSVVAMPITGWIGTRVGSEPVIVASAVCCVPLLIPLATTADSGLLGIALFGFGATMGTLDVAMNMNSVAVEHREGRPPLSGFHPMHGVGGFMGAGCMTFLLSLGAAPLVAAPVCCGWASRRSASPHRGCRRRG